MDQRPEDRSSADDLDARLDRALKREVTSWLVFGAVAVCAGILAAFGFFGVFIYKEIAREMAWQHRYGTAWRSDYEKTFGPLSVAHLKIAAAFLGVVIVPAVSIWIIKLCWPRGRRRHH